VYCRHDQAGQGKRGQPAVSTLSKMRAIQIIRARWTKSGHAPHAAIIRARISTTCSRASERISGMLLTWHNLHDHQQRMQERRDAIGTNTFADVEQGFHAKRAEGENDPR